MGLVAFGAAPAFEACGPVTQLRSLSSFAWQLKQTPFASPAARCEKEMIFAMSPPP